MIIKKGQRKRIKCEICKNVKNATLIHAKKSFAKTWSNGIAGEVDTFVLHYRIGKHQHGTRSCKGSDKVQKREHDGLLNSEF
ncbi:MAG: hypothetical protein KGZ34_07090 [Nitrosarchaeum sp.]|nr:hypothetical protein [Nitrosarchaeum sp.]